MRQVTHDCTAGLKSQPPGYSFESRDYEHFQVIFVRQGNLYFTAENRIKALGPGELLVLRLGGAFKLSCGNVGYSGVFFCDGRYEIQVLDCYQNKTYADGMAGAVYGQHPPLVNVCRPPGQWQTYDILWRAPRFEDGKLVRPATVTVLHNGVLVQDHWEVLGQTYHKRAPDYHPHPSEGSITLQDHGNPMRFRNIWLRPLKDEE